MRRLIYAIAALILGTVAAAAVVPYLVGGNAYRPRLAAAVEAATGLEAAVHGDVRVVLLPRPALTFDRLSAGLGDDGRKTVEIEAVRIDLALAPLFAGRAVPRAITLTRPVIDPGATGVSDDAAAALSRLFLALPDVGSFAVRDGTLLCRQPWMGGHDRIGGITLDLVSLPEVRLPSGSGTATVGTLPISFTVFTPDIRRLMVGDDGNRISIEVRGTRALCPSAFDGTVAVHLGSLSAEGDVTYRRAGAGGVPTVELDLRADGLDRSAAASALDRILALPRPAGLRFRVALSAAAADLAGYSLTDLRLAASGMGDGPVSVELAGVLPGDARLSLDGVVSGDGQSPMFDGKAELQAASLAPVLDVLGLPSELLPADRSGPSLLAGDLRAGADEVRLENLRVTGAAGPFSGAFVARPREWPSFALSLSGDDEAEMPDVVLDLDRKDDGSDAWDFKARLATIDAPLDLRGSARLDAAEPSPMLRASVEAGEIDIAGLIDWFSGGPELEAADAPKMAALAALTMLSDATADIGLAAAGLTYLGERIDAPELSLQWRDGALALDILSGRYRGGALKGGVRGRPGKPMDVMGQFAVEGAELAGLDEGPVGVVAGRVDADLRFSGAGDSTAEVLSGVAGEARFTLSEAVIKGLDLAAINKRLSAKQQSVGVVGILTLGLLRGRTKVPAASGTLKMENGIVVLNDTAVTADGGRAEVFGSADLARGILDASAHLRFDAHPEAAPVVMRLSGALAAPNFVLDPKPFQRWLENNR